ncbi:MAG: hypothetical protein EXR71_01195 [Myxococcales bacterium]|nr:hypothetical protein [Myxococcales bacterium]
MEKDLTAGLRGMMLAPREEMAGQMERNFLDQGMDVRVRVSDKQKDQLTMVMDPDVEGHHP